MTDPDDEQVAKYQIGQKVCVVRDFDKPNTFTGSRHVEWVGTLDQVSRGGFSLYYRSGHSYFAWDPGPGIRQTVTAVDHDTPMGKSSR